MSLNGNLSCLVFDCSVYSNNYFANIFLVLFSYRRLLFLKQTYFAVRLILILIPLRI